MKHLIILTSLEKDGTRTSSGALRLMSVWVVSQDKSGTPRTHCLQESEARLLWWLYAGKVPPRPTTRRPPAPSACRVHCTAASHPLELRAFCARRWFLFAARLLVSLPHSPRFPPRRQCRTCIWASRGSLFLRDFCAVLPTTIASLWRYAG